MSTTEKKPAAKKSSKVRKLEEKVADLELLANNTAFDFECIKNIARIRRGRIVSLMANLHMTRVFLFASIVMNIVLAAIAFGSILV